MRIQPFTQITFPCIVCKTSLSGKSYRETGIEKHVTEQAKCVHDFHQLYSTQTKKLCVSSPLMASTVVAVASFMLASVTTVETPWKSAIQLSSCLSLIRFLRVCIPSMAKSCKTSLAISQIDSTVFVSFMLVHNTQEITNHRLDVLFNMRIQCHVTHLILEL